MKTLYESLLDNDLEVRFDHFGDLYNDAVKKIPTIDDFVSDGKGKYILNWDSESLFDMYRDHYPKALHPRIKGMGIFMDMWSGEVIIRWYMLDLLKNSKTKDLKKLRTDYNRTHIVGEWQLNEFISSKKAMKLVIKQIESFVKNPTEIKNWLDRLESQLPYTPTNNIIRTFPKRYE